MGYTNELRELIKVVEETRLIRLAIKHPWMTPEEKQIVLKNHHPDYIASQFRPLKIGPNRGEKFPHELADVLEAQPKIDWRQFDEQKASREVDVLIIGGGGAGAAAALVAHAEGASVLLATKLRFGDSNTVMAQGGIQAATKENDTPAMHYLDVMGGGHYANVPELVRALVSDAPGIIGWLEELGCMFDKETDGTLLTQHGGGTSRKRMHSARDYTGAEIMRTLRDEVLSQGIEVEEFSSAVELMLDEDNRAAGAVLYNMETGTYEVVKSKTTILTTGGLGRLHIQGFPTSNHYGATADGLVLAYRAGAKLVFMDTMQYHPTGACFPAQLEGLLVTEKVRSLGATLVNIAGQLFINPMETRDVTASAILRECADGRGVALPLGVQGVWLDSPMIDAIHGEGTIEKELPAMLRQFSRFGVDIRQDPLLVYPTLHYQNGGILINANGESTVENLYVAGEAAGGVHGRNRLMGNSLLDILVVGRRAGRHAAKKSQDVSNKNSHMTMKHVENFVQELKMQNVESALTAPILLPLRQKVGATELPQQAI